MGGPAPQARGLRPDLSVLLRFAFRAETFRPGARYTQPAACHQPAVHPYKLQPYRRSARRHTVASSPAAFRINAGGYAPKPKRKPGGTFASMR